MRHQEASYLLLCKILSYENHNSIVVQNSRLYKELGTPKQKNYKALKNFIVLVLLISSSILMAQEKKEKPELENSNHSLNIELFGAGFSKISLSYEYALKKRLTFGAGLGYKAIHHNLYTINNTGSPDDETVWSKQLFVTIPLYMSFKTHKNKHHHMLFTLAVTPVISYIYNGYSKDPMGSRIRKSELFPSFAIGYEYNPGTFYFRLNVYYQHVGENDIMPSVMPWFGLSVGRYFKHVKE